MAKHKKKRTKKTSKGLHTSIGSWAVKAVRNDRSEADILANKLAAWKRGKKVFMTVTNPNPEDTKRRFIRVSFDSLRGGSYKELRSRVKRSDDNNKVEFAL